MVKMNAAERLAYDAALARFRPAVDDDTDGPSLHATYLKRLEGIGRAYSAEGRLVLYLARSLDSGEHTAAGQATLAMQLQRAAHDAFAGAPIDADELDELGAKRRTRFG